jgi:hypothetical protein
MIQCTECGKFISEYADHCPNCGCPTKIIKQKIKKGFNFSSLKTNIGGYETTISISDETGEMKFKIPGYDEVTIPNTRINWKFDWPKDDSENYSYVCVIITYVTVETGCDGPYDNPVEIEYNEPHKEVWKLYPSRVSTKLADPTIKEVQAFFQRNFK